MPSFQFQIKKLYLLFGNKLHSRNTKPISTMKKLKSNETRAKIAITLIWIVMAFEIISLISGYLQYDLLQSAAKGEVISMDVATANDIREQIVALVYMIVFIISGITFILWFRRAYYNLHQKIKYLSHPEGWAAGAWFVPIINLFRPCIIMIELYQETQKLLLKKGLISSQRLKKGIVGLWWTLWIISTIVGQIIFQYSMKEGELDDLIFTTIAGIVMNVIGIPLALITIKIIKDYAKVEPLLFKIDDEEKTITPNIGSSTTLLDD